MVAGAFNPTMGAVGIVVTGKRPGHFVALTEGGWDGPALEYTRPARPVRGRDPQP